MLTGLARTVGRKWARITGKIRPGVARRLPGRGPGVALATALVLAGSGSLLLSARDGRSAPKVDVIVSNQGRQHPLRLAGYGFVLERNPMGIDIQKPPPPPPPPPPVAVAAPPPPPPPPPGPTKATGLKLLGTLAAGKASVAILQEPGGRSDAYAIGDIVSGRVVAGISRKRVTLRVGGREEYLELPEEGTPGPAQGSPSPAPDYTPPPVVFAEPPPPAYSAPAPPQYVTREIPRADVVRQFGNPANFLSQVIAEPYYENSRFAGYYIQEIKPESYAASLGVQAGDILETVNGDLIDNVQKAFRLLGTIQRAPEMQLAVRRGGDRMMLTYRLQ